MRRECKQRLSALLMALLLFTLSACASDRPAEEAAEAPSEESASLPEGFSRAEDYGREPLAFSNALYPDSALTGEQRAMLDSVQQIADAAVFDPDRLTLELVNTASFPVSGTVYTTTFDENGTIRGGKEHALNFWEPGEHRQIFYGSFSDTVAEIGIEIEFHDDAHWYNTALRRIEYHPAPAENEVVLLNPYTLPYTFTTSDNAYYHTTFRVDAIKFFSRWGNPGAAMDLTVAQAPFGGRDEVYVRAIDEEGVVVSTTSVAVYGIKAKEKYHLEFLLSDLEPGTYTISILEY